MFEVFFGSDAGEEGLILTRSPLDAEEGGLDAEADVLDGWLALDNVHDLFEGLCGLKQKVSSIPECTGATQ